MLTYVNAEEPQRLPEKVCAYEWITPSARAGMTARWLAGAALDMMRLIREMR
jgi:hypothetical protein